MLLVGKVNVFGGAGVQIEFGTAAFSLGTAAFSACGFFTTKYHGNTARRPVENPCQYPFSPEFPLSTSIKPKYKVPKRGTIAPFNLLLWI
ncbi:MAG: hypothetical protein AUG89_12360 [Acidobacteria bacterium 13_1_20CM_4_56_7]|nr:MAG: hypothetical protein AUG89_12360 [Acidobacteria bacterium 13_1_20CM_4_56_7]